jgi:hypothetical protein
MDWMMIAIFVGLIMTGFIVGYPLGHALGHRHGMAQFSGIDCEPIVVRNARNRLDSVLDAEILEERR